MKANIVTLFARAIESIHDSFKSNGGIVALIALVTLNFYSYAYPMEDVDRWNAIKKEDLKMCSADPTGEVCNRLAKKRDLGFTPMNSNYLSIELLEKSCEKKNGNGCALLAKFRVNHLNAKECYFDFETGETCFQYGLAHEKRLHLKGTSKEDEFRYAKLFFERACERKHKKGCERNVTLNSQLGDFSDIYSNSEQSVGLLMNHRGLVNGILIRGEVKKGDYQEFESLVQRYSGKLNAVFLDSHGGDAIEAMKIGRLIRRLKLETWAPYGSPSRPGCAGQQNLRDRGKKCTCLSACFLIHVAGVQRHGSLLGVHRIFPSHQYLKGLDAEGATSLHNEIKRELTSYMTDMGVPDNLTNLILSIPSNEMRFLTTSEIENNVPEILPEHQEWLLAKCGNILDLYGERRAWLNRNKQQFEGTNRTIDELAHVNPELRSIEARIEQSHKCERSLFDQMRTTAFQKTYRK